MKSLFGIPINSLLIALVVFFALCAVLLTISILRNRVMFKMGARNLPRRPANTVLTCLGLMLAAMIFSASFATGDTLTYSIRSLSVDSLGQVDIMVMREGTNFGGAANQFEGAGISDYFSESEFQSVRDSLSNLIDDRIVDGVAPAIIETVPVKDKKTSLNEPAVTLLGLDHQYMEPFDPLLDKQGHELSLKDLEDQGNGHIYVSKELAEKLDATMGDTIDVNLGGRWTALTIADVYETGGNPTTYSPESGGSMVMPLKEVQSLISPTEINFILITNHGGKIEGAHHTDATMAALVPSLEGNGLKAEPVKKDGLDSADEAGNMFSIMFVAMGSFSIIAGIMLIFLIFVMLAAERKRELGIARAVGTQRGHIIRLFTYEGVLYALGASAMGSGLGLLVSWAMMWIVSAALEEMGFQITYHFTLTGIIISYTLGVVLTVLVVIISAWRVSNLNIICAIKDIPEPKHEEANDIRTLFKKSFELRRLVGPVEIYWIKPRRAFRLVIALAPWLLPLLGLSMLFSGIQERDWTSYSLGTSLVIIGLSLLAKRLFLPDRAAYTLAGIALLIFWFSPVDWHPHGEEMGAGFEMFVLTGVMLVLAAVWVVMYNSDLLLRAIMALFGRLRALTPIIKTAVSYPMTSRFRTGMALAMFALIVFTLVWMSSMNASIAAILDDTGRVAGGFHIRAEVLNNNNRIPDIEAALDEPGGVGTDNFKAIASFYLAPVSIRDVTETSEEVAGSNAAGASATEAGPKDQEWEQFYLFGVDAGYTENVSYGFELMMEGFTSKEQVWKALKEDPFLALVSADMVPTKNRQMGDNGIDTVIGEGQFYLEDKVLPKGVYFEVQSPKTGATQKLQVIGIMDQMAGPYAYPLTVSEETLRSLGYSDNPVSYRFQVKPESIDNVPELAKALEKQFLDNGMNTHVMAEEIKDFTKIYNMFWNLMIAFMGLGLIVGIAALGVIAARSVVERRQQIGMLRAIGFQQGMVQFSFLLESSFVSLLGISLGVALGVGTALLFMGQAEIEGIKAVIPWTQIVIIVGLAYLASLITTFLPAYQAARIYPAEALRYE